jgi:hypothetical protein
MAKPVPSEHATDHKGENKMARKSCSIFLGRFVAAPPKTPATVVEILRKGFRDTFDNSEFKAESERVLPFQLVSFVGDDAEKVNAAVFRAATGPVREALRKMTQE